MVVQSTITNRYSSYVYCANRNRGIKSVVI